MPCAGWTRTVRNTRQAPRGDMSTPQRTRMSARLACCLTLGTAVLVGAAVPPVSALPSDASTLHSVVSTTTPVADERCGQVLLIGVRGSGQTAWGREMAGLRNEIVKRARGIVVDTRAIDYPSAPVGLLLPTPNQLLGLAAGGIYATIAIKRWATTRLGKYLESIAVGVRRLRHAIDAEVTRCEDREIVLTGYSQGAMVVHRALVGMTRDGQNSVLEGIAAVGLLADGDRMPHSRQHNLGSAANGAMGLTAFVGPPVGDIPKSMASRTFSYCTDNDIVCDTTVLNVLKAGRGSKIHTTYSNKDLARLAGAIGNHLPKPPALGEETGRVEFDHDTWGPSTFITNLNIKTYEGFMRVVDGNGRTRWLSRTLGSSAGPPWYHMQLHSPPIDATGQIFVDWNPGRYNGVTVLEPVADGMASRGTIAENGNYRGRFYYADIVDVEGDGVFEIAQHSNDCNPTCAGGTITTEIWRWDGVDYVAD